MKIDHWLPLVAMKRLWRIAEIKPEDICWCRWEPWWWEYVNTFSVSTSALCWQHPLIWAMGTLEQPLHLFLASRETQCTVTTGSGSCMQYALLPTGGADENLSPALCPVQAWNCLMFPQLHLCLRAHHHPSPCLLFSDSPTPLFPLDPPSSKPVLSPSLVLLLSGTKALLWNG